MSHENFLTARYGLLMKMEDLSEILGKSTNSLRISLSSRDSDLADLFGHARIKIGRRVYFKTLEVAAVLDGNLSGCELRQAP